MIAPDEPIVAEDFINQSEADPTPANNEGKVPKLEANGRIHASFLSGAGVLYGESTAGSDDYAVTIDGVEAYTDGMAVAVLADVTGASGATLNINSLGAVVIKKRGTTDLTNSDIMPGQVFLVVYSGSNFYLVGAGPSISGSSGSGSNIASTLPITLAHNFGAIPRDYDIVMLGSGGNKSMNFNHSGGICGRVGNDDSAVGGAFQMGTDDSNWYLIDTTIDANNITLSLNTTFGSPGTIAHTWLIRARNF